MILEATESNMSFTLIVFIPSIPQDLAEGWPMEIAKYGDTVEPYPGFSSDWRGGVLFFRMIVQPDALPPSSHYGLDAVLAYFELYYEDAEFLNEMIEEAPAEFKILIKNAQYCGALITSAGRTPADWRLQYIAAATLAVITGGVLFDPQQDAYFTVDTALSNAIRAIGQYEANKKTPEEWEMPLFTGWEEINKGYDGESDDVSNQVHSSTISIAESPPNPLAALLTWFTHFFHR